MIMKPLKVVGRIVLIILHALANASKKIVGKFFANPRVRIACMAYARHAENILLASIIVSGIALLLYLILFARNSAMGDIELIAKSVAVFAGFALPGVPALVIMYQLENYKLQMKKALVEAK